MELEHDFNKTNHDFREKAEIEFSKRFESIGYVIYQANAKELDQLKHLVVSHVKTFLDQEESQHKTGTNHNNIELASIHENINSDVNNKLRLYVMEKMAKDMRHNYLYYKTAKYGIDTLCGSELAMQRRISLSIQMPHNKDDILPVHADTWNGVSAYDLNIWIPLVDCTNTMCLYFLTRDKYIEAINNNKGLLNLDSDLIYTKLKDYMTWIEIKYGQILAFDQSMPHGYSLNRESSTQWSMNCRFKNLFSPYLDKQLGDYYMPITTSSMSKIGMKYEDPREWFEYE